MAISITWGTKVINIPKADTTLIQSGPPEIRELNINNFRAVLNDLQDSEEGMSHPTTHVHGPPLTVGGVALARTVEIVNGYTVTFESGAYQVNLVGANNNVADVVNMNAVAVRSANSAGLIQVGSGVEEQDKIDIAELVLNDAIEGAQTLRQGFRIMYAVLAGKASGGGGTTIAFRDLVDYKDRVVATVDNDGNRTAVVVDGTP